MERFWIGKAPCGCMLSACSIDPLHPERSASAEIEMRKDGLITEEVTRAEYLAMPMTIDCPHKEPTP